MRARAGVAGAAAAAAGLALVLVLVMVLVLVRVGVPGAPDRGVLGAGPPAPPAGVRGDYQLGGDSVPAAGVGLVVRDWFSGSPLPGGYSVCYVNAFQTQPDEAGVERSDESTAWPAHLVLDELGEDPGWPGELLVDISSSRRRAAAAAWVEPMLATCADKGFDAVELDNLDSWTRFDGTPRASAVPFGKADAVAYAALLTSAAHDLGLAVAQKNTPDLDRHEALEVIGFDLAVAEECGRYDECHRYTALYGSAVLDVEYEDAGFARACREVGDDISVVRRDLALSGPSSPGHVARWCPGGPGTQ